MGYPADFMYSQTVSQQGTKSIATRWKLEGKRPTFIVAESVHGSALK